MVHKHCPLCETGNLEEHLYDAEIQYRNATGHISGFKYSVCDNCHAEITSAAQSKHNKLAVVNFKRTTDGLLTTDAIKAVVDKLGITASEASAVIGGGPVAFSKYINGAVTQSQSIDNTLRLLYERPEIYQSLKSIHEERVVRPSESYKIYHHLKDGISNTPANTAFTKYEPNEMTFSSLVSAPKDRKDGAVSLLTRFFRIGV